MQPNAAVFGVDPGVGRQGPTAGVSDRRRAGLRSGRGARASAAPIDIRSAPGLEREVPWRWCGLGAREAVVEDDEPAVEQFTDLNGRYLAYYHQAAYHLALDKDAPDLRPIELPATGNIKQLAEVGGLHHRYVRQAA